MIKERLLFILIILSLNYKGNAQLREFSACESFVNFDRNPTSLSFAESLSAGLYASNNFLLPQLSSGGVLGILPTKHFKIASAIHCNGHSKLREFRYTFSAAKQLSPALVIGSSFILKNTIIPETNYRLKRFYSNVSGQFRITDNLTSILAIQLAMHRPDRKEQRNLHIVSGTGYQVGKNFKLLCDMIKSANTTVDLIAGFEWKTLNNTIRFMVSSDERFLAIRFRHDFNNVNAILGMELHSRLGPSTELQLVNEFR